MNIKEYREKKARGLAEVVRAGGGYAFATTRYSTDDGSELNPDIESIDVDSLVRRKAELEAEVEDYTALIVDVEKLK